MLLINLVVAPWYLLGLAKCESLSVFLLQRFRMLGQVYGPVMRLTCQKPNLPDNQAIDILLWLPMRIKRAI